MEILATIHFRNSCLPVSSPKTYKVKIKPSFYLSRRSLVIFLFTTASRTALGPTQPPVQCVPGALSVGVKWPGCEADHSPPSSAEVKEWVELYPLSPNTPPWRWAQLKESTGTTLPYLYRFTSCLYGCETWCLASTEEYRSRVFENRMLRRILQPKRNDVMRYWTKTHNEEFQN
jgi:hypothetical protein